MAYGVNAPFGLRPLQSISGGSWTEKTNEYYIQPGYGASIFEGDPVVFNTTNAQAGTIGLYNPGFRVVANAAQNTFAGATPILGVFISCMYFDLNNKLIQSPFWPGATAVYPGSVVKAYVLDDPDAVFDIQISTPINATANNVFAAAPILPNINTTINTGAGIGGCFQIFGGGGANFNNIPSPFGGFYTNNPKSTSDVDNATLCPLSFNTFGGSTTTGQSGAYLCVNTSGSNATTTFTGAGTGTIEKDYSKNVDTLPLKVIGYSQNPKNIAAPGLTLATTPFINVRVMINNHVYRAGTVGTILTAA